MPYQTGVAKMGTINNEGGKMETNENHALAKAEGCYHCKPLVQQRNELKAVNAELLEALEEIVEQLEGEYFNFSKARAAIAKAEGL